MDSQSVVTIDYSELSDETVDLSERLENGFGAHGMGIVAISNVPDYAGMRESLLALAERLSKLPKDCLDILEDPDSRYSFGWSHGKESLQSGEPDHLKASFYANPLIDMPTEDQTLAARYPSYCRRNLWPSNDLPELESAFKMLGGLIVKVGLQLAFHCDKHVTRKGGRAKLKTMLENSFCHKGRLLHYYPSSACLASSDWCGWHVDHGSLTGLTCAMYTKQGREVNCPDLKAGLYIKTRSGAIVKACFGKNDIAYQMGEATEIMSDGAFHATPHCVRAAETDPLVERNTFAVFMQPHWDEPFPEQRTSDGVKTFGEFSEELLIKYYGGHVSVS